eukprot:TRINITY_DN386_c0_g1_i1.p2 TRINITY_DN386_c0_g1~~TRINITY_DN386_c0_g1_i1.p2  ORF type:complete len:386 (-),score=51.12 TRINITY_DN386_c0_g1_i1:115-1272(-)
MSVAERVLNSEAGRRLKAQLSSTLENHLLAYGVFKATVTAVDEVPGPANTPFANRNMTKYKLQMGDFVAGNPNNRDPYKTFTTTVREYDCGPRGPVEGVTQGSTVLVGVFKYNSECQDNCLGVVPLPAGSAQGGGQQAAAAPLGSAGNMIPGQTKPFPASWGEPPMMQTKDLREWPEGYGRGSGTVAKWIQDHLNAAPRGSAGNLIPGQTKPFPASWGEPPAMQTRDFREWPQGYGQGSGTVAKWIQEHLDAEARPQRGSAGNLIPGQTKPFPASWGEPPTLETRDLRQWPQGYGQGSGTIAKWIEEHLPLGSEGKLIPGQTKPFPSHWGEPPMAQSRDMREWPQGYGQGSGTVATWIQGKLDADKAKTPVCCFAGLGKRKQESN